ncbi:hypothetical protein LINGRAHAP2_LOCUS16227 [Linum grandiflorum]
MAMISSFVTSSALPASKTTLVPRFPNLSTNNKLVSLSSKVSHPPLFPALVVDDEQLGDAGLFPIPMTVFGKRDMYREEADAGLFPIPRTVFGKGVVGVKEGDAGLFPIPRTIFGKGVQDVSESDAGLVPIPRTMFGKVEEEAYEEVEEEAPKDETAI